MWQFQGMRNTSYAVWKTSCYSRTLAKNRPKALYVHEISVSFSTSFTLPGIKCGCRNHRIEQLRALSDVGDMGRSGTAVDGVQGTRPVASSSMQFGNQPARSENF